MERRVVVAVQRYISTSFYDDTWVHRLDPSEKFMYMYLLTNGLTNIAGVYKIGIDRMVYDTGFNEHTVKHILEKFEKAKKAFYRSEYIVLPSWPDHQKWEDKPKIKLGIEAIMKTLNRSMIAFLGEVHYRFDLSRFGGIAYDRLSLGINYSDSDSDSDSDFIPTVFPDTPCGESDMGHGEPKKAVKESDPLYTAIWDSFLSITPRFANYQKEGACTKAIAKSCRNLNPEDPGSVAKAVLAKYLALTKSREKLYSGQPFTPSGLSPHVERVWALCVKDSEGRQAYEEALNGLSNIPL